MSEVRSPGVGIFEPRVGSGALVRPRDLVGRLIVLDVAQDVRAPDDAIGIVVGAPARGAVSSGDVLVTLDPSQGFAGAAAHQTGVAHATEGLTFTAPTSGRFYSRSAPGKPPFVSAGDTINDGQTICMLEVMKTFNRVVYTGVSARVLEVVAADEADVDAGAVLLRLEAV